jgi:hypothetical protein
MVFQSSHQNTAGQGKPRLKRSYEVVRGLRHRTALLGEEGEGEEVELELELGS